IADGAVPCARRANLQAGVPRPGDRDRRDGDQRIAGARPADGRQPRARIWLAKPVRARRRAGAAPHRRRVRVLRRGADPSTDASEGTAARAARRKGASRPGDHVLLPRRPLHAYGYLTPFVISTMSFDGSLVTLLYFVYGAAAVTGGGLAGVSSDRFGPRRTLLTAIVLVCACLLIIPHTT